MNFRHSRILLLLLFGIVVTLWTGCAPKTNVTDDSVVATWGDTTITVADFKNKMYIRYRNEPTAMKQTFEDRMRIFDEYTDRDLKLAEARRLGYDKREDINQKYEDALERGATEILYNQMVRDKFFTDEMINNYWEHDQWEVHARHLLIKFPEGMADKDTLEYWNRINEVWKKVQDGEDFKKLIDRYSEDTSIERRFHGDLGWFKWGKMVDSFQDAVWKLKPGEVSPPIRTRYGYHIAQLIEKRERNLEVNTSHILVKCSRRADPAETTAAYERADMILKEAKKKGADFAQLARRYSEDKATWVNGEVGFIPRGSMPSEYWDAVFEAKENDIIGPVRTYKGYHIIWVKDSRVEQEDINDPDVRASVMGSMSRIYRDTLRTMAEKYLDDLMKSFEMEYVAKTEKLMLKKLNDSSAPANMNRFNLFTLDERNLKIIEDNIGGLTIGDLADKFGENAFPPEYKNDHEFIAGMVEQVLVPKYLGIRAREKGLTNDPKAIKPALQALDNAMLPEIEREIVFNKSTPSEEQIEEHYKKNIDKYTTPPQATAVEILVSDKTFAEDLLKRIQKGEDIQKLAQQYTQRPQGKRSNGIMKGFVREKYGRMSQRAFELEIGKVSEVIDNGSGMYSIIKVLERTPQEVRALDDVRREIESNLRFERQKEIKEEWIKELRASYNLKVNTDVIKNIWPLIEPLPEPMVDERNRLEEDRKHVGERAAAKRKADNEIQLKLKPGSTQTFRRDGKDIQVKIGEPRYVKDGEKVDPQDTSIKLTPKSGDGDKPVINLKKVDGK